RLPRVAAPHSTRKYRRPPKPMAEASTPAARTRLPGPSAVARRRDPPLSPWDAARERLILVAYTARRAPSAEGVPDAAPLPPWFDARRSPRGRAPPAPPPPRVRAPRRRGRPACRGAGRGDRLAHGQRQRGRDRPVAAGQRLGARAAGPGRRLRGTGAAGAARR